MVDPNELYYLDNTGPSDYIFKVFINEISIYNSADYNTWVSVSLIACFIKICANDQMLQLGPFKTLSIIGRFCKCSKRLLAIKSFKKIIHHRYLTSS